MRHSAGRALGRCVLLTLLAGLARAQSIEPATVRIGVLSLFHPQALTLSSAEPIALRQDDSPVILDRGGVLTVLASPGGLTLRRGDQLLASGVQALSLARPATFTLAVPGKLRRTYTGGLELRMCGRAVEAVVVIETERAVASVVAAESPPGAPREALAAQAVAVRSFLLSAHRHAAAERLDACDTTHCQFLREPPSPDSAAARATEATHGMVLTWTAGAGAQMLVVPALYTRSCDGHTRPASPARPGQYPFFAVRCGFCLRHLERWSRAFGEGALPRTESERLIWNRTHPNATLASNHFIRTSSQVSGMGQVSGIGSGHGFGLCQMGAVDLATHGASFRVILGHFYPNTSLRTLPEASLGADRSKDRRAE